VLSGDADRTHRSFAEFRLPPGRHGIPPDQVAENQRWRLLGAAAEVLAEQGHVNTNSTRVSKAAGVSPATFYQHFDNIGACLLAAYEAATDCVMEIVSEACREEQIGWPERLGVRSPRPFASSRSSRPPRTCSARNRRPGSPASRMPERRRSVASPSSSRVAAA